MVYNNIYLNYVFDHVFTYSKCAGTMSNWFNKITQRTAALEADLHLYCTLLYSTVHGKTTLEHMIRVKQRWLKKKKQNGQKLVILG